MLCGTLITGSKSLNYGVARCAPDVLKYQIHLFHSFIANLLESGETIDSDFLIFLCLFVISNFFPLFLQGVLGLLTLFILF